MGSFLRRFARRLLRIHKRMRHVSEAEVEVALLPFTSGTRGADASFTSTFTYPRAIRDSVLERIWDNEEDDIFDTW